MLSYDTLIAARDAVANKEISAQDLTRQALARIREVDQPIQAFNEVDEGRALMVAREVDDGIRKGRWPACRSR